jgi:hypothetical protein
MVQIGLDHVELVEIRQQRTNVFHPDTPSPCTTASGALNAKSFPWGVQLLGGPSELAALTSFYQMQKAYRRALASHAPIVIRTPVGTNGSWYRVRVGMASRNDAERLCSDLRAAGGSCLIQPN